MLGSTTLEVAARLTGTRVGTIARVTESGQPLVNYPGNSGGPRRARSLVEVGPAEGGAKLEGAAVLLAFEDEAGLRPVVLGLLRDRIVTPPPVPAASKAVGGRRSRDILVEGRRLTFDAGEEIMLRCGKATILLRANGEVIVKGARLASRSTGAHTIKGATVRIN